MNRREFMSWVGVGMFASSLPVVLAACNSSNESSSIQKTETKIDTSIREDGFQALGTIEDLAEKGVITDKKNAAKSVLIFRHPDTEEIVAFDSMCTHQGCSVEFKAEEKLLVCPCHSSKYDLNGRVVAKPAPKPLTPFEIKQEDNLILVKVI
ncbi:Rieske (2Fe-2S) protein [Spirulina sp. 06S082]|uniref:QcrA and Rieske domain-containing protein n=1 Tax=Spirulina sp. 06S082 TaxID=3110248 RepID=UPI002B1FC02F|nr:Rieske (2Fe-2S) protein [Spirulina sp. 06S082]MEA5470312.1 Rieske (2Fe-2S) protein [Spirulina sp. 06S082]